MDDTIAIVIWCVGVAGMATTAWLQDRRDIRAGKDAANELREDFEERITAIEKKLKIDREKPEDDE